MNKYLEKPKKPTNSSVLFPQLKKHLAQDPSIAGNLKGLFIIQILLKSKPVEEWFMTFKGNNQPPQISQTKPELIKGRVAIIALEDQDLLKFIVGGLHGVQAISEQRIKIAGDIEFCSELEQVFIKMGGIEKAKEFLSKL